VGEALMAGESGSAGDVPPERPGSPEGVAELADLSLEALRTYRAQLTGEESRISYWRRIVQARLDLLASTDDVPPLPDLVALWDAHPDDAAALGALVARLSKAGEALSDYRSALHRRLKAATTELIARYAEDPSRCLVALPLPLGDRERPANPGGGQASPHSDRHQGRVVRQTEPGPLGRGGFGVEDDVVRRAPLFAALEDEAAAALRSSMVEVSLRRGDVLFAEGDPGDRLYLIIEGKVKLGRTSADGRDNLLAVLGPGEMFGELSLFDPGPRTATATAVVDTDLLGLGHDDLQPWLRARPDVAMTLLRALAQRLRRTNEAMADLVFSDVPGRVAKALLDLARRFGVPSDDGLHVTHDLTQEELAQLVGASRETVNKALADFQQRGWIRHEARAVVLLDTDRLARRAR
jgi:CRP/FNR family transcriptional regulator, cyclic AMP receptor protein